MDKDVRGGLRWELWWVYAALSDAVMACCGAGVVLDIRVCGGRE